ncbi:MAG: GNAT family N-acetyltransferase [Lachnospiraceae bacterium]|nr:GNAT family N-acetyltransferase [Lachnospiraceae bacterium]
MIRLRELELKDAERMLEWMHDSDVVEGLRADFKSKTIQDCRDFIHASRQNRNINLHLAIADEENLYLGTVSLKNIDMGERDAEFAIALHCSAMGKGIAIRAMCEVLRYGSERLELKHVYWCVGRDNIRAVRFYDKNGFMQTRHVPKRFTRFYQKAEDETLRWYQWSGTDG